MPPLYVTEQGAKLEVDNRRATVTKDGETLASVPLIHVSEVVVMGNVGLTTPAIKALLGLGVDVVFLTLDGAYCGRLVGPSTPHVLLRRKQYRCQSEAAFTLEMAQKFVAAKIQHMRAMLQRHNRPSAALRAGERSDAAIAEAILALGTALEHAPRTTMVSALTGARVRGDVAMTGEITIKGKILPIGGVKDKVLAAHRLGIRLVVLPEGNRADIEEVPKQVRKSMKFIWVEHMDQVLAAALRPEELLGLGMGGHAAASR